MPNNDASWWFNLAKVYFKDSKSWQAQTKGLLSDIRTVARPCKYPCVGIGELYEDKSILIIGYVYPSDFNSRK